MKRVFYYYLYLILVWGLFRYFIRLPEVIEELWFKPIIWLVPLFWWSLSMKKPVLVFGGNAWKSLKWGVLVGIFYFLLIRRFNFVLTGGIGLVVIAMATAMTEELTFSGFVLGYLERMRKGRVINLIVVGVMAGLIRLPILYFIHKTALVPMIAATLFAMASGLVNGWIRVESENVTGSILARWILDVAVLG